MNKQQWFSLREAWKAERAHRQELFGFDKSTYICWVAEDIGSRWSINPADVVLALKDYGISSGGDGFDLPASTGGWPWAVMRTQDHTPNDRRLYWLQHQVENAHE